VSADTLAGLRARFLVLAARHGRDRVAEHLAAGLGWDQHPGGRQKPARVARRGVFVMLGLERDRHDQLATTIQGRRAAMVYALLDGVEKDGLPARQVDRVARHGLGAGS
jgi:hypothetical protein